MTSIRIEAEDMGLTNYRTESGSFASGGKLVSLAGASGPIGTAKGVFTGGSGSYDIVIGYYDENDGVSPMQVSAGGVLLSQWSLNQNLGYGGASSQTFVRRTISGVSLTQGTAIEIKGTANQAENARVDYIEFIPVENSPTMPTRIEAEDMGLTNYRTESGSFASGGKLVSLAGASGPIGTAKGVFTGGSGSYDIVIGYYDENDGVSPMQVSAGGVLLSQWSLNQNLGYGGASSQTFVRRTISGVSLTQGTAIEIKGTANQAENARVDYIEFIPVVGNADTAAPTASLSAANITTNGDTSYTFSVTYSDNQAVDASTIDGSDIRVTGPSGFNQLATLVNVNSNSNDSPRTATYRISAAGGSWDSVDNGTYTVAMQANQVGDTSGNFVSQSSLGAFQVNVQSPLLREPTSIRMEAEDMTLTNYRTESGSFASGEKLVSLAGASSSIGTAKGVFAGASGSYDIVVGYYDENDGVSQLQVSVGGTLLSQWSLNQDLDYAGASSQTLVRRTVASGVSLTQGTAIDIKGTANQGEFARVDYIEFIPVNYGTYGTSTAETLTGDALNNIINGVGGDDTLIGGAGNDILIGGTGNDILDGGTGIDTASYAQATSGIIANLQTGVVTRIAKLMPLGDSITHGIVNSNLNEPREKLGGYRAKLWDSFRTNNLTVNFVGSMSAGPDSLGDKDHEGHPSKTIDWIDGNVNGWLNISTPDIVMLMIGTNDTRTSDSVSQMSSELSGLIDKITQHSPDTQVLVASIPPIRPDAQSQERVQKALDFNAAIPNIVGNKVAEGKKVKFVDTTSLTANDISSPPNDNGVHPTVNGYTKITDFWYDALLGISVSQGTFSVDKDTLSNIENIVGTPYNDTLVGNAGVNNIQGGAGRDTLTGGGSVDTFIYGAPTQGGDTITDYSGNDIFHISASGFGGGLRAGTALSMTASTTGVFVSDANPTPVGTSANFLYNTGIGVLSFDRDGTGSNAALMMATLNGVPSLGYEQFAIIA